MKEIDIQKTAQKVVDLANEIIDSGKLKDKTNEELKGESVAIVDELKRRGINCYFFTEE